MSSNQNEVYERLLEYLPTYYREGKLVKDLLNVESEEISTINTAIQDVLNQYFIDRATTGLDQLETTFNIPVDLSKDIEDRRSILKARLRGIGTVTVPMLQNLAEAYAYGKVSVTEYAEEYRIEVKFIDERGIPKELESAKKSLREVVPAHISMNYHFTYLIWDELDLKTWDEIEAQNAGLGMTWDQLEVWK